MPWVCIGEGCPLGEEPTSLEKHSNKPRKVLEIVPLWKFQVEVCRLSSSKSDALQVHNEAVLGLSLA